MKRLSTCMVTVSLALLANGCSEKTEQTPEDAPVTAPADVRSPMPIEYRPSPAAEGDPNDTLEKRTLGEVMPPAETPPPMPSDHRLHLGIDGDPGYTQDELTPEELAKVRAAGAASPPPSYNAPPSEPSRGAQPSEPSDDAAKSSDSNSDNVYVGGTRAPVYRHHAREEAREDAVADHPHEPGPAPQPQQPRRANPPRGGAHR